MRARLSSDIRPHEPRVCDGKDDDGLEDQRHHARPYPAECIFKGCPGEACILRIRMPLRERPSSIVRCTFGEPSCPGVVFVGSRRGRGSRDLVFLYRLVPGALSGMPGSRGRSDGKRPGR